MIQQDFVIKLRKLSSSTVIFVPPPTPPPFFFNQPHANNIKPFFFNPIGIKTEETHAMLPKAIMASCCAQNEGIPHWNYLRCLQIITVGTGWLAVMSSLEVKGELTTVKTEIAGTCSSTRRWPLPHGIWTWPQADVLASLCLFVFPGRAAYCCFCCLDRAENKKDSSCILVPSWMNNDG